MSPIVVLGTGRSGTSVVANMLHVLGVYMGDEFNPADENNPLGTYEDVRFDYEIRKFLRKFSTKEQFIERVGNLIQDRENNHELWGWKMPSTSEVINHIVELVPEAKYIVCMRPKDEFIESCIRAYSSQRRFFRYLYDKRTRMLEKHLTDEFDVLELSFEDIINSTEETVDKIIEFCDLDSDKREEAVDVVKPKEEIERLKKEFIK